MVAPVQKRVPFAPIERRLNDNDVEMAKTLGTNRTVIARWRKTGIPIGRADSLAVRIGAHPAELWPFWYETTA